MQEPMKRLKSAQLFTNLGKSDRNATHTLQVQPEPENNIGNALTVGSRELTAGSSACNFPRRQTHHTTKFHGKYAENKTPQPQDML